MVVCLLVRFEIGVPTARHFLEGRDVDIAVVEDLRSERHFHVDEAPILPYGVAAQGGGVGIGVLGDEIASHFIGGFDVDLRLKNAIDESGLGVMFCVPIVHRIKHGLRAFDGDFRTFGDDVEVGIGDERGNFDDVIDARVESGHFAIDPDEWLVNAASHGNVCLLFADKSVADCPLQPEAARRLHEWQKGVNKR